MTDLIITCFVYETLLSKGIRREALAGEDDIATTPTSVSDFAEIFVHEGKNRWPTLEVCPRARTMGDNLLVTVEQFAKLRRWESRYECRTVQTDLGPAWAFFWTGEDDHGSKST